MAVDSYYQYNPESNNIQINGADGFNNDQENFPQEMALEAGTIITTVNSEIANSVNNAYKGNVRVDNTIKIETSTSANLGGILLQRPEEEQELASTTDPQPMPYFAAMHSKIEHNASSVRADLIHQLGLNAETQLTEIEGFLKEAPMTINFNCDRIFCRDITVQPGACSKGILNYWERPVLDPDQTHRTRRNQVEVDLFEIDNDPLQARIANPDFVLGSSNRPTYAALNVCQLANGAAPGYSNSYVKLKEELKEYTTLLPNDSFDDSRIGDTRTLKEVASFKHPEVLIKSLGTAHLTNLKSAVDRKDDIWELMTIHPDYIECHIHFPVTWDKVEELVINFEDLDELVTGEGEARRRLTHEEKLQKQAVMIENSTKLQQKHGFKLTFVNKIAQQI